MPPFFGMFRGSSLSKEEVNVVADEQRQAIGNALLRYADERDRMLKSNDTLSVMGWEGLKSDQKVAFDVNFTKSLYMESTTKGLAGAIGSLMELHTKQELAFFELVNPSAPNVRQGFAALVRTHDQEMRDFFNAKTSAEQDAIIATAQQRLNVMENPAPPRVLQRATPQVRTPAQQQQIIDSVREGQQPRPGGFAPAPQLQQQVSPVGYNEDDDLDGLVDPWDSITLAGDAGPGRRLMDNTLSRLQLIGNLQRRNLTPGERLQAVFNPQRIESRQNQLSTGVPDPVRQEGSGMQPGLGPGTANYYTGGEFVPVPYQVPYQVVTGPMAAPLQEREAVFNAQNEALRQQEAARQRRNQEQMVRMPAVIQAPQVPTENARQQEARPQRFSVQETYLDGVPESAPIANLVKTIKMLAREDLLGGHFDRQMPFGEIYSDEEQRMGEIFSVALSYMPKSRTVRGVLDDIMLKGLDSSKEYFDGKANELIDLCSNRVAKRGPERDVLKSTLLSEVFGPAAIKFAAQPVAIDSNSTLVPFKDVFGNEKLAKLFIRERSGAVTVDKSSNLDIISGLLKTLSELDAGGFDPKVVAKHPGPYIDEQEARAIIASFTPKDSFMTAAKAADFKKLLSSVNMADSPHLAKEAAMQVAAFASTPKNVLEPEKCRKISDTYENLQVDRLRRNPTANERGEKNVGLRVYTNAGPSNGVFRYTG